jgi:serine/threonine protein kinase
MRFTPGTQLGTYEVVAELGAGGMGEVYRARDTSLLREVAIKFVNPSFCNDPDSLSRLRREARALASLNHPHVATVHELAEFDGFCGVVMELVAGETLAETIARRPLPVAEAIRVGAQVAAALEAAHDRDLVHRDLKPANIKVTPEGSVKVLDFGLAKSVGAESDSDPMAPLGTMMTGTGVVLGTVSYMSPEQARGAAVDRRTDIWALGCVLFEMLTGRRAFEGPSATDTLVMILEREPDWSRLPANTPAAMRRLLRRCLAKDTRRRLRDVGDARLELEDAATPAESASETIPRAPDRSAWFKIAALVALGVVGGVVSTMLVLQRKASEPTPEIRFSVIPPAGDRLGSTDFPALAISPDGRLVTYVAGRRGTTELMLHRLNASASVPLPGTANALSPFFSPDSQWIAFFADGSLKKVPVAGGPSVTICAADDGFGGSWAPDDTIVFAATTGSSLSRVPSTGGVPSRATRLAADRGEFSHRWPEVLPDGKTVLYTVGTVGEWDEAEIVAESLESGRREVVLKGGTHPHYLVTGHLLYTHADAVWIAPFDTRQLRTTGPAARVLEGVVASVDGAAQFAVSRSGTAAYVASTGDSASRLVVIDGTEQTPLAAPPRPYLAPRVSPNGRRLVVEVADRSEQIWMYDVSAGELKQLTFEASNRSPIWTPDGARVTFSSNRNGALNLFLTPTDGTGAAERLTTSDHVQLPGSWSPDGTVLAFVEQNPASGRDIWLLRQGSGATPWANAAFDESAPRFSPDGQRIAYVSNEFGRAEVFVRPATPAATARQVSTAGGMEPIWARDGRTLFFRAGPRLMAVPILDAASLRFGPPRQVFEGAAEPGTFDTANYDVMSGATRFVIIMNTSMDTPTNDIRMIVNWNPLAAPSP